MIPGVRRFDPFRISTGDFGADGSFHSVDLANKLRGCAVSWNQKFETCEEVKS